jgi:hypothetical protein
MPQPMTECNEECCQVIFNGQIQQVNESVINLQRQINIDASAPMASEDNALPTYEQATSPPSYEQATIDSTCQHLTQINLPIDQITNITSSAGITPSSTVAVNPQPDQPEITPTNSSENNIQEPTVISLNEPYLAAHINMHLIEMPASPINQEELNINSSEECVVGKLYTYKGDGIFQ